MGPFVAGVESVCGAFVLLGLVTRLAAIPLLIDISVAIISTILNNQSAHSYYSYAQTERHFGLGRRKGGALRHSGHDP